MLFFSWYNHILIFASRFTSTSSLMHMPHHNAETTTVTIKFTTPRNLLLRKTSPYLNKMTHGTLGHLEMTIMLAIQTAETMTINISETRALPVLQTCSANRIKSPKTVSLPTIMVMQLTLRNTSQLIPPTPIPRQMSQHRRIIITMLHRILTSSGPIELRRILVRPTIHDSPGRWFVKLSRQ